MEMTDLLSVQSLSPLPGVCCVSPDTTYKQEHSIEMINLP